MQQRDAFDVVKDLLVARRQGTIQNSHIHALRHEVLSVAVRMERVKNQFPTASLVFGLGEDFQDVLKVLRGGRGLLGHAALL